jgi:hypothetical protein
MTAKGFKFIAGVISNLPLENDERRHVCQEFMDHLRVVNVNFDERIFMAACHVESIRIPAYRIRVGDFIPVWGTVTEIDHGYEVISIKTDTCDPTTDEWAMSCDRNEPVSINIIDQARRMRELSAHTARRSGT